MSEPPHDKTRSLGSTPSAGEQFHLLMDCVADFAIFLLDAQGRIASWNAGARRIFGYSEAEILGEPFGGLFTPEDREMGQPESDMAIALLAGRANVERWHLRKDGGRFWAAGSLTALRDRGGNACGFAKITRDMTGPKLAEDRLLEADRRRDELLAMLVHDLRNPLAVISIAAELVKVSSDERDREWNIDAIRGQVRHLVRIADDLLDVTRGTRGINAPRREPIDLGSVLGRTIEAVRPLLSRKKHHLSLDLATGPIDVDGDPARLEQAFTNLLDNAVRYTPEGGRIEVAARRDAGEVVVEVRDNGVGIGEEMLHRVFDLLAPGESPVDQSQGWLGLGLTLARQIVEMHGGRIAATSDGPGRGSLFTVWLPVRVGRPTVEAPIEDGISTDKAGGRTPQGG
jgi:PAS domain S-box-containing protein